MKNLILRTATGVLFVALLVGGMMAGATYFAVLFTIITALTLWEFAANINLSAGGRLNPFLLAAAGELIFLLCFALASGHGAGDHLTQNLLVALLLALILIPVSELYLKGGNPLRNWAFTFAALIYIALPFGLLAFTAFPAEGGNEGYVYALPLSVFVFLWANDTGAYCVGSLLHRRFPAKLFPSVSPAKSWIGSIGGCLVTLGIAFAAHTMSDVLTLPQWLGFGLTVCVAGTYGDLVESQMKRTLGIKDSGHLLPGHGGLLDRFDSSLLAIPASVIYLTLVCR